MTPAIPCDRLLKSSLVKFKAELKLLPDIGKKLFNFKLLSYVKHLRSVSHTFIAKFSTMSSKGPLKVI